MATDNIPEFEVVLTGLERSETKLPVTKTVMEITELNLEDAKRLVETAPKKIVGFETLAEAERVSELLTMAGARVNIKQSPVQVESSIDDDDMRQMETSFSSEVTDVLGRFEGVLEKFDEQVVAPVEIGLPNLPTIHNFKRKSAFRKNRQEKNENEERLNPLYQHLLSRKELEDRLGRSLRPAPPELDMPSDIPSLRPVISERAKFVPHNERPLETDNKLSLEPISRDNNPQNSEPKFWVKNKLGKISGPFTETNLRKDIYEQKVRPTDMFTMDEAGETWDTIESRFKRVK